MIEWQNSSRFGIQNNVAIATTSTSNVSSAFGAQTRQIRVAASAVCYMKIGPGVTTAANTDALVSPNWPEYITVNPNDKIAVFSPTIQTVSVTEIA